MRLLLLVVAALAGCFAGHADAGPSDRIDGTNVVPGTNPIATRVATARYCLPRAPMPVGPIVDEPGVAPTDTCRLDHAFRTTVGFPVVYGTRYVRDGDRVDVYTEQDGSESLTRVLRFDDQARLVEDRDETGGPMRYEHRYDGDLFLGTTSVTEGSERDAAWNVHEVHEYEGGSLAHTTYDQGTVRMHEMSVERDAAGRLVRGSVFDERSTSLARTVEWSYDDAGRPSRVRWFYGEETTHPAIEIAFEYDAAGGLVGRTYDARFVPGGPPYSVYGAIVGPLDSYEPGLFPTPGYVQWHLPEPGHPDDCTPLPVRAGFGYDGAFYALGHGVDAFPTELRFYGNPALPYWFDQAQLDPSVELGGDLHVESRYSHDTLVHEIQTTAHEGREVRRVERTRELDDAGRPRTERVAIEDDTGTSIRTASFVFDAEGKPMHRTFDLDGVAYEETFERSEGRVVRYTIVTTGEATTTATTELVYDERAQVRRAVYERHDAAATTDRAEVTIEGGHIEAWTEASGFSETRVATLDGEGRLVDGTRDDGRDGVIDGFARISRNAQGFVTEQVTGYRHDDGHEEQWIERRDHTCR